MEVGKFTGGMIKVELNEKITNLLLRRVQLKLELHRQTAVFATLIYVDCNSKHLNDYTSCIRKSETF